MSLVKQPFQLTDGIKTQFLHLLRRMLREVTYLPDPVVRKWHHDYILSRFRKYRPVIQDPSQVRRSKTVRDEKHQEKLLQDCQSHQIWLYRAGMGDLVALKKAMFLAYGRIGPKKHELLKPLLEPDTPMSPQDLEASLQEKRSRQLQLSKPMLAILKSQMQKKEALGKTNVKLSQYTRDLLPEKNIWGRPMPLKRIVNAKKKAMLRLKSKILPPMSKSDLLRVKGLVEGTVPVPSIPKRRARPASMPQLPWVKDSHDLNPRAMRRLWSILYGFSSTIVMEGSKPRVEWGGKKTPAAEPLRAGEEELTLFSKTTKP